MNYFLKVTSKPKLPLVFDAKNNLINGSFLAVGRFIKEEINIPLKYYDSHNSNIDFEKLVVYDVLETVGGGMLFSERFINFLYKNNFNQDVQIFKAQFEYKNKTCNSFFAVNIFNKLECYDLDKSIYKIHPVDNSYKFEKIVLKNGPLEEYDHIYNIVRSAYDNKIIVSQRFRELFINEEINSINLSIK